METLEELTQAIMADEQNKTYTEQGIKPLFSIPKTARINIVGQAPGIQAQESGIRSVCHCTNGFLFPGAWKIWRFRAPQRFC